MGGTWTWPGPCDSDSTQIADDTQFQLSQAFFAVQTDVAEISSAWIYGAMAQVIS